MVQCLRPRDVAQHNRLWFNVAQWAINATTVVQRSTAGHERDHDNPTGELFNAGGAVPRPLILMSIHGGDVEILVECAPENRVCTGWLVNQTHCMKYLCTQLQVPTLKTHCNPVRSHLYDLTMI